MADYQKMYTKLFRAVTKSITLLQEAQRETEEIFISADEPNIVVLPVDDNGEDDD
jgi:hypothetical protein